MNLAFLSELPTIISTQIASVVAKSLYTFSNDRFVDLGPNGKWRMGHARLRQNEQEVTLFLFEKITLDETSSIQVKLLVDLLRHEALVLQRLRHPNVLSVVSPLAESRAGLSFAVKPVEANLANVMNQLSALEVKAGLLDIGDALLFLHRQASLAHLNINPWSIFIDFKGTWLLGGTAYVTKIPSPGDLIAHDIAFHRPRALLDGRLFNPDPPIQYAAPEQTRNFPGQVGFATDVFAFGILTYQLLSKAMGNHDNSEFMQTDASRQTHATSCDSFAAFVRSDTRLETDLRELIGRMLRVNPRERPQPDCLKDLPAFYDVCLRALKFIEHFGEKDDFQKRDFLVALPPLLKSRTEFQEPRILRQRILPVVAELLTPQHFNLWSLAIGPVLWMAGKINCPVVFQRLVWPRIQPLLCADKIQVESIVLFVEHIEVILVGTTEVQSADHCIPFILKCLSMPNANIQRAILDKLGAIMKHFEQSPLQQQMLPQVLRLLADRSLAPQVRATGIKALAHMAGYFKRDTIISQLIPALRSSAEVLQNTDTASACFRLAESIYPLLGDELTVRELLPIVIPLLSDTSLEGDDFRYGLKVIGGIIDKYAEQREREYDRKYESQRVVTSVLNPSSRDAHTITPFEDLLSSHSQPTYGSVIKEAQKVKPESVDLINLQSPLPQHKPPNVLSNLFDPVEKLPSMRSADPFAGII